MGKGVGTTVSPSLGPTENRHRIRREGNRLLITTDQTGPETRAPSAPWGRRSARACELSGPVTTQAPTILPGRPPAGAERG